MTHVVYYMCILTPDAKSFHDESLDIVIKSNGLCQATCPLPSDAPS